MHQATNQHQLSCYCSTTKTHYGHLWPPYGSRFSTVKAQHRGPKNLIERDHATARGTFLSATTALGGNLARVELLRAIEAARHRGTSVGNPGDSPTVLTGWLCSISLEISIVDSSSIRLRKGSNRNQWQVQGCGLCDCACVDRTSVTIECLIGVLGVDSLRLGASPIQIPNHRNRKSTPLVGKRVCDVEEGVRAFSSFVRMSGVVCGTWSTRGSTAHV